MVITNGSSQIWLDLLNLLTDRGPHSKLRPFDGVQRDTERQDTNFEQQVLSHHISDWSKLRRISWFLSTDLQWAVG